MKDFHAWISDMSNSIPDASEFIKDYNEHSLTPLQIRVLIADLIVPTTMTEDSVYSWLSVFCVDLNSEYDVKRFLIKANLSTLIGEIRAKTYCDLEGNLAHAIWLKKLKRDIKNNIL